jgi:hypothetical protein
MARQKSNWSPGLPCDFCVTICAEIAEGKTEKDEQNKIAEDSFARYRPVKRLANRPHGPGACHGQGHGAGSHRSSSIYQMGSRLLDLERKITKVFGRPRSINSP